ncbi:hypothetical protein [Photobacterium chitinilyticum]|uniref:hypothetical protein n=1 Tax=Photobacterium chitinilyticum TaxID=2485123 RepID=UPI001F1F711E|nr:hypothetical protein [Photobacterium chitinilyticum]
MDAHRCTGTLPQLRHPDTVMSPDRLGAMHQTRISFVRSLIRRMANQNWQTSQYRWDLSEHGFGTAIYRLTTPEHHYHLVVFSDEIADDERNDRVIAEKWDITFALVHGDVDDALLAQLQSNVPLQEAGRNTSKVLVLARANKSVRVFDHLVEALSQGQQPDSQVLASVGYILRTTAVYGNGKFGIADFEILQDNHDFNLSFSAQMCAVYMLRQFSLDWIHFLAQQQGGEQAIQLARPLQRYLGVGNATGLGMAPYLINHPRIVDQWLSEREKAIAAISNKTITPSGCDTITPLLQRACLHLQQVVTIDAHQRALNHRAVSEIETVISTLHDAAKLHQSWLQWLEQNQSYSYETQEIALSCLLELYPDDVDSFENTMNADENLTLSPGITVCDLQDVLATRYRWALDIDFSQPENTYWFWYRSEDKEEPRMGVRGQEPGEDRELGLDIAYQVYQLNLALAKEPSHSTLAEFLLKQPQFRSVARRAWTLGHCPMGDIQMNVLSQSALPMHLLRCKLAMFGATKFDPRSDRWVRVTFFQGAPLTDEIHDGEWLFPLLPADHTDTHANNCVDTTSQPEDNA